VVGDPQIELELSGRMDHDLQTLLASPVQATRLPAIGPRNSSVGHDVGHDLAGMGAVVSP